MPLVSEDAVEVAPSTRIKSVDAFRGQVQVHFNISDCVMLHLNSKDVVKCCRAF